MKNKFIEILESLGYPVYLQGSINENEEYPESFFTYWVFQADENSHYDNGPVSCDWGFWLYFYSAKPALVESVPLEAKSKLQAAGFAFAGKPVDAESDEPTHTGCMMTCYIKEVY